MEMASEAREHSPNHASRSPRADGRRGTLKNSEALPFSASSPPVAQADMSLHPTQLSPGQCDDALDFPAADGFCKSGVSPLHLTRDMRHECRHLGMKRMFPITIFRKFLNCE